MKATVTVATEHGSWSISFEDAEDMLHALELAADYLAMERRS